MSLEKAAQCELDNALERQELFWKEKSSTKLHMEGDRNTAYFHRLAKIKNSTKLISSLKNGNEVLTEPTQLVEHVVNYFQNLFCTNPFVQDSLLVEEVIPSLVGGSVNNMLTMLPSREEIQHAVLTIFWWEFSIKDRYI
ncbi:hypothetical protein QL285_007654 [Trifolium repens]|jgi:hypothetical protein|nr:hypothetical protein QL285_007654 [Trifolium repens]